MNHQDPPEDSLAALLQLRGQEALEFAVQQPNPFSCGLIAASVDTLNLARLLLPSLERRMTQDDVPDQLESLLPLVNQFLQLNRFAASALVLHSRLRK